MTEIGDQLPLEGGMDPYQKKYQELQEQYADLCTLGEVPSKREARYEQGLRDFDELKRRPWIRGIAVKGTQVFVGTTCTYLYLTGNERPSHIVGEFVVTLTKAPPSFLCENNTLLVEGFHHPHVNKEGVMCIDTREEINSFIGDGALLKALDIIWIALNTCDDQRAYGGIEQVSKWPRYEPEKELRHD